MHECSSVYTRAAPQYTYILLLVAASVVMHMGSTEAGVENSLPVLALPQFLTTQDAASVADIAHTMETHGNREARAFSD